MRLLFLFIFIQFTLTSFSQEQNTGRKIFSSLQYAGSIGAGSIGAGITSPNGKLEYSLHYGYLPRNAGGVIHTAVTKFGYIPWRIRVTDRMSLTPLQAGAFIAQHFGNNLETTWDARYPKGYYWWARNTRLHPYLSAGFTLEETILVFQKTRFYLEANTNDLYLYSYLPNTRALSPADIVFFGAGINLYLR